jgi:hypothetical protein
MWSSAAAGLLVGTLVRNCGLKSGDRPQTAHLLASESFFCEHNVQVHLKAMAQGMGLCFFGQFGIRDGNGNMLSAS